MPDTISGMRSYIVPQIKKGYADRFISLAQKNEIVKRLGENHLRLKDQPNYVKKDLRCVLAAVAQDPESVIHADNFLKSNAVNLFSLWLSNTKSLSFVPFSNAMITLVKEHPEIVKDLTLEQRRKIFPALPAQIMIHERGLGALPEATKLKQTLLTLGISRLERLQDLNLAEIQLLINNHMPKPNDQRHVTLMVYPKADYNNAFGAPPLKQFLHSAYRFIYTEVESDTEFFDAVKKYGSQKAIQLLAIAGHGNSVCINFGINQRDVAVTAENQHAFLDIIFDKEQIKELAKKGYLTANATINLEGCSNAKGRNNGENVISVFHTTMPKLTVMASEDISTAPTYELINGRVSRINHYHYYFDPIPKATILQIFGKNTSWQNYVEKTNSKMLLFQRDSQSQISKKMPEGKPKTQILRILEKYVRRKRVTFVLSDSSYSLKTQKKPK